MSELFLKEEKVLTLRDTGGVPSEIDKIINPELLPLFLRKSCTTERFQEWMKLRSIPENREGFSEMKKFFGDSWIQNKNYASLSDQYWIRWRDEKWKRVNFFTNTYSPDVGTAFFEPWEMKKKRISTFSPDLTTNGVLKKRWIQMPDKTSRLAKAGSLIAHQEPLSEVLVSVLTEKLGGIKSAGYNLYIEGTTMCSICDNFIDENTELVPMSQFYYDEERPIDESVYDHILKMCDRYEIPGAKEYLDWLILIDNMTGNEDRNLGNIGFIRDVNTLKFIGPAPLYDCGNAYWSTKNINDKTKSQMFGDIEARITSKMKKKHDLSFLKKEFAYKKIIMDYPEISAVKKENLIEAIGKRNNRILNEREIDDFEH